MYGVLTILDSNGKIVYQSKNLIVENGRRAQAQLLKLTSATDWQIGVGTDDGSILPLEPSNTTLGAEIAALRQSAVISEVDPKRIRYEANFSDVATPTVHEAGLFIVLSTGTLLFARRILATGITIPAPPSSKLFRWDLFT